MLTAGRIGRLADGLFGFRTHEYFHYRVGPGDVVKVQVARRASIELTLAGSVESVNDHGYYRTIAVRSETGEVQQVRLYRDGPKDEDGAAVGCQVVEKRFLDIPRYDERGNAVQCLAVQTDCNLFEEETRKAG